MREQNNWETVIADGGRSERMWEKQPWRHQGQWRRRGRKCSRHQSRCSSAACSTDHGEAAIPLQPMGSSSRDHLQPVESPCWSKWRWRLWPPQEAHTGASLLTGFATPWGIHAGAIKRTAVWGKGLHWRSSWKTVSHGRHPVLEKAKRVSSCPEKEGAAQTACDDLVTATIPCGVEDVENLWVKLSLGKREGWE